MKRRAAIAAGALALLAAAYAAGRYSAPVKVEERVEYREIASYRTDWAVRVETVERTRWRERVRVVEVIRPDGTVERREDRDSAGGTDSMAWLDERGGASGQTTTTAASIKVTENARPGWSVGVVGLWDPLALSTRPERWVGEVDRRIAGTVWLGLRGSAGPGFDQPRLGAALRLEF